MSVYNRLQEIGIEIPKIKPRFNFELGVVVDKLLFISGQTPEINGEMQFTGKLGENIDIETGKKAARLAVLNCLSGIESIIDSLDNVERIVRLVGYVRSGDNFGEQPLVIDGASELLIDIFGERGKHARAALGTSELPFGAPVEIKMIVQVKDNYEN